VVLWQHVFQAVYVYVCIRRVVWRLVGLFEHRVISALKRPGFIIIIITSLFPFFFLFLRIRKGIWRYRIWYCCSYSGARVQVPAIMAKSSLGFLRHSAMYQVPKVRPSVLSAVSTHTTAWYTCCHNTATLITMYFYWLILQKRNFNKVQLKLPEDGPNGPKHVGANIKIFNCKF
jgi:hypothetical protein